MFRLDKFMRVCDDDVKLPDGRQITIRTLSETETNARHDYGVAEAVRVSLLLKDESSELYNVKIRPLLDASLDDIILLLIQGRAGELAREAGDLYRLDYVPVPEQPTLTEEVEAEQKQRKTEAEVYALRENHIRKGIESYREKIKALPADVLAKEIKARAQQVFTFTYSQDAEMYYTVWCSAEADGKRVFNNVEEVKNLPGSIITYLYNRYNKVDDMNPWEVTKSLSQGSVGGVEQDHSVEPAVTG